MKSALLVAAVASEMPSPEDFTQAYFDNKINHLNYQSTATYK
jgi:hypothetical protein